MTRRPWKITHMHHISQGHTSHNILCKNKLSVESNSNVVMGSCYYNNLCVYATAVPRGRGVEGGAAPRGFQGSALKTSRKYIDRIYEIAMKISSDRSYRANSESFIMPQFPLDQSHWSSREVFPETMTAHTTSICCSPDHVAMHAVSPDGDSSG